LKIFERATSTQTELKGNSNQLGGNQHKVLQIIGILRIDVRPNGPSDPDNARLQTGTGLSKKLNF